MQTLTVRDQFAAINPDRVARGLPIMERTALGSQMLNDEAFANARTDYGKVFLHEPAYISVLDWAEDQERIIEHEGSAET